MSAGRSVRLFLADGTPGGLLTAEIMNWTGHVMAAPRSDLAALLKRREISRTGIYILIGDDPDRFGSQMAYVGEGDDVGRRLYQHARSEDQNGKEFWDRAIVLTSKDANLTKAHARYLESRFIGIGREANRATLANATAPRPVSLPESDESDMEYFIEQAMIMLPVLGVNIFRSVAATSNAPRGALGVDADSSPTFELRFRKEKIVAMAREIDGEFTVLEGSRARLQWVGGERNSYSRLRAQLEADQTLVITPGHTTVEFSKAQVFASPSAAAAVILGRNANGRNEWIGQESGISYGEWQQRGIDEAVRGEQPD